MLGELERFRILNVNDDEAARYTVSRMLQRSGFQVIEAATGQEALLRVGERPDVIVLDVKLPDLSGYDVCAQLKQDPNTASIGVLLTSATFVSTERKVQGLEVGADGYLTQPFEHVELVATVKSLLRIKQAEGELRARAERLADADRRKDEFLAMLAHELRNPLAAMLTATTLLERYEPRDRKESWSRDVIKRQSLHLDRIVSDLLDVSRVTRGLVHLDKERIDLSMVLARLGVVAEERWALTNGLDFRVSLPDTPVWVEGDPTRIEQVITNLLDNAAKFTEPGGSIGLSLAQEGDRAVIRVTDTGMGIPAEKLSAIFDTFVQGDVPLARSRGGLGIGLSLVRRLVGLHGGSVTARSEGVGRGAEFEVVLPALAGEAANDARAGTDGGETRRRILLVEDNNDIRETLREVCEAWGHEVHAAADGARGLELGLRIRPDVALVDLGLPGIDGFELARRLRESEGGAAIHLVALTGYGAPEYRERALAAGFDVHLVKPIETERLRCLLASAPSAPARAG